VAAGSALVLVLTVAIVATLRSERQQQRSGITYDRDSLESLHDRPTNPPQTSEDGPAPVGPIGDDQRVVFGIVRSEGSLPIRGARVGWVDGTEASQLAQVPSERVTQTANNGSFRLAVSTAEGAQLIVRHPHFVPSVTPSSVIPDATTKDAPAVFVLKQGGVIRGKVRLIGGGPASYARIFARGHGTQVSSLAGLLDQDAVAGPSIDLCTTTASQSGEFELAGLSAVQYVVEARLPGMLDAMGFERNWRYPRIAKVGEFVELTLAPFAFAAMEFIDSETNGAVPIPEYFSVVPTDPYFDVGGTGSFSIWLGDSVHSPRSNRLALPGSEPYCWYCIPKAWPVKESVGGKMVVRFLGYRTVEEEFKFSPPEVYVKTPPKRIKLEPLENTGILKVRLLDIDRIPIRGLRVKVDFARPEEGTWVISHRYWSRDELVFSARLPVGSYSIFEHPQEGAAWTGPDVTVLKGKVAQIELLLAKPIVTVHLEDERGRPIENTDQVRLSTSPGAGPVQLQVFSNGAAVAVPFPLTADVSLDPPGAIVGRFKAGRHTFKVESPLYETKEVTVNVPNGKVVAVRIRLKRAAVPAWLR